MNERLFGGSDRKVNQEKIKPDLPSGEDNISNIYNIDSALLDAAQNDPQFNVVKKDSEGRIMRMERVGSTDGVLTRTGDLPEGITKVAGFAEVDPSYDQELTQEQKADLNNTLRTIIEKFIPKPKDALKGLTLAALIALAQGFKEKEPVTPDIHTNKTTFVSDGSETEVYNKIDQEEIIPGVLYKDKGVAEAPEVVVPETKGITYKSQEYQIEPGQFTQSAPMITVDLKIPELKKAEPQVEFVSEAISEPEPEEQDNDSFTEEVEKYSAEIDQGDINAIKQYADKPVIGAEDYTRIQYVREKLEFREWNPETGEGVPSVIQEEVRRVFVGLCSQESGFNAGLTSKVGAKGILQFMPDTWAHYGGKPWNVTSLKKQVEIAGLFISDLYTQLNYHIGNELLRELQSRYVDEASFQRDLMAPLIINAYNVGAKRMAEGVQYYMAKTPTSEMPTGKDLYLAIANYAESSNESELLSEFNDQSGDYALKAYAQAKALDQANRKM